MSIVMSGWMKKFFDFWEMDKYFSHPFSPEDELNFLFLGAYFFFYYFKENINIFLYFVKDMALNIILSTKKKEENIV